MAGNVRASGLVPLHATRPDELTEFLLWPNAPNPHLPAFPPAKTSSPSSPTPGKVGKREIAQAFNIKGGDRIWLKQMLKDLEIDGVVDRRGKSVHRAGPTAARRAGRHHRA